MISVIQFPVNAVNSFIRILLSIAYERFQFAEFGLQLLWNLVNSQAVTKNQNFAPLQTNKIAGHPLLRYNFIPKWRYRRSK